MLSQRKLTAYPVVTDTLITVWRDDFSGNFRFSLSDLQCIHLNDYICIAYPLGRHISESVFVSFYENVEVF